MSLIIKCKDCKLNDIEIQEGKGVYKKYCDDCLKIRKRISDNRKNVSQRAKRLYPKLLINLTKNYILFVEGIK